MANGGSAAGPCRQTGDRARFSSPACFAPLGGEIVIVRNATSAFVGADLEARLDELGATTLVLCGTLATHALEASARHAGDLGYQVFVVADACRAADAVDLRGRLWPAEDVRALALAQLKGETATIVDVATALRAAAMAKARQPRGAGGPDVSLECNRRRKCSVLRAAQYFQWLEPIFLQLGKSDGR